MFNIDLLTNSSLSTAVSIEYKIRRKSEVSQRTCKKFLNCASFLESDSFLAWTFDFSTDGHLTGQMVSNVSIPVEDMKWIFENTANISTLNHPEALLCNSNGFVTYVISSCGDDVESFQDQAASRRKKENNKEAFSDLIKILEEAQARMTLIEKGEQKSSCGKTRLLLILNMKDEMSMRLRSTINESLPNARIEKYGLCQGEENDRSGSRDVDYIKKELPVADQENEMLGFVSDTVSPLLCEFLEFVSDSGIKPTEIEEYYNEETLLLMQDDDENYFFPSMDEFEDDSPNNNIDGSGSLKDGNVGVDKEISDITPVMDVIKAKKLRQNLDKAGIKILGQLKALSDEELFAIQGISNYDLQRIRGRLNEIENIAQNRKDTEVSKAFDGGKAFEELEQLVGLESVKEQVKRITALARMKADMNASGKKTDDINLNMMFSGNPGTAKTTVARILAGIFYNLGFLKSSEIVEIGRADLVALYEGQTAHKVKEIFKKSKGKLIFIDEAYSLVEAFTGAYGDEAIATIVQEMENCRKDTIVVFAGYPKEMDEFMSRNPGLHSRVPFKFNFCDYSQEELLKIVKSEVAKRNFSIREDADEKIIELCRHAMSDTQSGNGRFCRNIAENAVVSYSYRNYGPDAVEPDRSYCLIPEDFVLNENRESKSQTRPIGFCRNC